MIGRNISQYRILKSLGRGGMGEVYLAEDSRIGHKVAIKLLPQRLAKSSAAKKRFLREAQAIAQLDHPYILPLHEFDESDGEFYFVTAYVSGGSLRDVLKASQRHPLPLDQVLRWAVQAAEGLAAAHKRGVVHRDIKPDNLLVTEDGDLRICDFGLATIADATRITHSGTTMGTLGYMSPEQVRGQSVDRCSDLYSLGATLYELLTGRAPFSGSDQAAILHAIAYDEPRRLSDLRPDLPQELVEVIDELMRKKPEERQCSAEQLATTLRRIAAASGSGDTMPLPAAPKDSRSRVPVLPVRIALGLMAVVIGVWAISSLVDRGEEPDAPATIAEEVDAGEVHFAVMPFSVQGALEVRGLAEGMVELLSSRFDGAAGLRRASIDERPGEEEAASAEWPTELAAAREMAARRGIEVLVRGSLVQIGGTVHINAELLSVVASPQPLARGSVEGGLESIPELLDQLTMDLLLERAVATDALPFGVESVQTNSLPALKLYLEGEWRLQTRGNWAGIEVLQEAVEEDPAFAMAWFRLADRYIPPMTDYDVARAAIARALEHSDQLKGSTKQLAHAVDAFIRGDGMEVAEYCRAVLTSEPDNIHAWSLLSSAYRLLGWKQGIRMTESLPALERLDQLGANVDWIFDWVRSWAGGIESREERLAQVSGYKRVLYSGSEAEVDSLLTEFRGLEGWLFLREIMSFVGPRDIPEEMEELVLLLTEEPKSTELQSFGYVYLGHLRAERGRWGDARQAFQLARNKNFPLALEYHTLLASAPFLPVPEEELRGLLDDLDQWDAEAVVEGADETRWVRIHDGHHPQLRLYVMGLLSARLGEMESALAYAEQLQSLPGPDLVVVLAQDLARGVRARVHWEQGDAAQALTELEKAEFASDPDYFFYSPFHIQSMERYLRAELLRELGRPDEALGWYPNPWSWGLEFPYLAPYHLRHAQIHRELGNHDLALKHYARFLEYWGDSDPELMSVVEHAREEMLSLQAEMVQKMED